MIHVPERELIEVAKTATDPTIPIAEIFGPTIQGEGALAGKPTYFLRVGGCDYKCVWCDTADAVLPERVKLLPRLTQRKINNALYDWTAEHPGPQWLTISGGNPGMYDLTEVVAYWQKYRTNGKVAVETQGSRWQPWFADLDCLTISPKPPSSEMPASSVLGASFDNLRKFMELLGEHRYRRQGLSTGKTSNEVLKVIVFDDIDYEFARLVHNAYPSVPFYLSCGTAMGGLSGRWVPPAIPDEDTAEDPFVQVRRRPGVGWALPTYVDKTWHLLRRYRWLAEKAAADPDMADAAIFPQLHVLTWGINTKGV